jgi:hypothetical protein
MTDNNPGFVRFVKNELKKFETNNDYDFRPVKAKIIVESLKRQALPAQIKTNIQFCQTPNDLKDLVESVYKIKLNEDEGEMMPEEEPAEALDKVSLFADLTAASSSLNEAINLVYPYKFQIIEDPRLKQSLAEIRLAISNALGKLDLTIKNLGTENDSEPENNSEIFS